MPYSRNNRHNRLKEDDTNNDNNKSLPAITTPVTSTVDVICPIVSQVSNITDTGFRLKKCCSPLSCRMSNIFIDDHDPKNAVRVLCNNEACDEGRWMHKDCFEEFEQSVLAYLRSCGRARSWSEKQRLQNLWTKKGYDLAFKACDCKCSRGHLRKDLDYVPLPYSNTKKQRKNRKKNDRPIPVVCTAMKSNSQGHQMINIDPISKINNNLNTLETINDTHVSVVNENCAANCNVKLNNKSAYSKKAGKKIGIGNTSSSMEYGSYLIDNHLDNSLKRMLSIGQNNSMYSLLPKSNQQLRIRTNSVSSIGSNSSGFNSIPSSAGSASMSPSPVNGDMFFKIRTSSDVSSDTGNIASSTGFRKRLDFSVFARLPPNKQNAYNIFTENLSMISQVLSSHNNINIDRGNSRSLQDIEEDTCCDADTRNFVLSNLLSKRMFNTRCALCKSHLIVFDRFPLIDGTFFLSPQAYDTIAIQVSGVRVIAKCITSKEYANIEALKNLIAVTNTIHDGVPVLYSSHN